MMLQPHIYKSQSPHKHDMPIVGSTPPKLKKRKLTDQNAQAKETRTDDVLIDLKVSLLEFYQSQYQQISVVRNRLCPQCDGKGKYTEKTTSPQGCGRCKGRGVFPDEKQFTFSIQGCSHGDKIVFKNGADEKMGDVGERFEPGDVVVALNQIPDPHFQREGPHLYIKKEIVLLEALGGGQFYIKHLDGRILQFSTRPGEILLPYQIKCIPNMGMPYKENCASRGHIFVQFEVRFPAQPINPHLISSLRQLLPPRPVNRLDMIAKQQPNRLTTCEVVDAFQNNQVTEVIKDEREQHTGNSSTNIHSHS